MILATHIILAIISIVYVSYAAISPSKVKLRITYFLTLGTIVSGFTMALINPVQLGRTCISGVIYLGFMIIVSTIARKRLVTVNQNA